MTDGCGRKIEYLRISITDRCNLRCRYCMPAGIDLISMDEILSYEEILEIAAEAAALGIRYIKVTGGEPLVRRGCPGLIARLKSIPGIERVTLTTNGTALAGLMRELTDAGLDAVNISLDTLDRELYRTITGRDELPAVLDGIAAALEVGIRTKLNTVLVAGLNDGGWPEMAAMAKDRPLDVRFIEMMPIGEGRNFRTVSNRVLRQKLLERFPGAVPDERPHGFGPATYLRIPDYQGSIGFISAVHDKFCDSCNRVRLTSTGQLKTCLCYAAGTDLRGILRGESGEAADPHARIRAAIADAIRHKPAAHGFDEMDGLPGAEQRKMNAIGG